MCYVYLMATLKDLATNAHESDISFEGGERYIAISGDDAVTVSEIKDLEGCEFNYSYLGLKLKKVNAVTTEIYENIDGRFLALYVSATFIVTFEDDEKEDREDSFTIWIPEEDGESIEAGNFKNLVSGDVTGIEPEVLEDVLTRFAL